MHYFFLLLTVLEVQLISFIMTSQKLLNGPLSRKCCSNMIQVKNYREQNFHGNLKKSLYAE